MLEREGNSDYPVTYLALWRKLAFKKHQGSVEWNLIVDTNQSVLGALT